ncbi:MAG: energy-coupling factor ABC transporter ATP-binding protein [Myxococcota bacterium]|nr:energy-coupling factor ABC transporter ATP-binding protein [Myxococcota bacterium]
MTAAIELRRVSFHFDDSTPALVDVSFKVAPGERVAVVGPNGAGKSTLLLHVAGLLPESEGDGHGQGEIVLFGELLGPGSSNTVRRDVGLLFQDPDDQLFCPTVGADVAFGPEQLGLRDESLRLRVADSLAKVGLGGFERRLPHRLSGGEKKRVALAGLLAYEPKLLAFDEPTSGLDPRARRQLITLLRELSATLIFATHDLALVAETCSRTIVLDAGRVVADGPTRTILLDDERMRAHGLEMPRCDLPPHLLAEASCAARPS